MEYNLKDAAIYKLLSQAHRRYLKQMFREKSQTDVTERTLQRWLTNPLQVPANYSGILKACLLEVAPIEVKQTGLTISVLKGELNRQQGKQNKLNKYLRNAELQN